MGLDHSGRRVYTAVRSVTGDDAAAPTGDSPSGAITVPDKARGSVTHVLTRGDGNAAGAQFRVSLYGLLADANDVVGADTTFQSRWVSLTQLNGGGLITPTTKTTVAPAGSDILYAESFDHISFYKKLYALVDDMTNLDTVEVQFVFEAP